MQAYVGKPIATPIIHNGPPESIVRINEKQVAYTFLKRSSGVTGGGVSSTQIGNTVSVRGDPITSYNIECRFTLIANQPKDNMAENEIIVASYMPPKTHCE